MRIAYLFAYRRGLRRCLSRLLSDARASERGTGNRSDSHAFSLYMLVIKMFALLGESQSRLKENFLLTLKHITKMKKNLFMMMAFAASVCVMTSCGGSSKAVVAQQTVQPSSASYSDLGPTTRFPLMREATEDDWYEVGTATGPKARMGAIRVTALRNARQLIRESMSEAYKGLVSEYSNLNSATL